LFFDKLKWLAPPSFRGRQGDRFAPVVGQISRVKGNRVQTFSEKYLASVFQK
jgi:hypothetical protein